jgi:hypothetical protein
MIFHLEDLLVLLEIVLHEASVLVHKQKGHSNLKALFDNCILNILCAWNDFQNLMK